MAEICDGARMVTMIQMVTLGPNIWRTSRQWLVRLARVRNWDDKESTRGSGVAGGCLLVVYR